VGQLNNASVIFSRDLLLKMLERSVIDQQFSKRRSGWMNSIFKSIVSSNLHQLTALIPATVQPVINCVVLKK
jgi:hypothetical protein